MTPFSYRPPLDLDLNLYRDQRECSLGIANLGFAPTVSRDTSPRLAALAAMGVAGGILGILAYLGAG
jgi:hypothetical protein